MPRVRSRRSAQEYCRAVHSGPRARGEGPPSPPDEKNIVKECTPKETMEGTSAIMDYSDCANLDSVSLLITDFDQNNFGQLDAFETCAKSFRDEENHGGRTALSCMKILKNAKQSLVGPLKLITKFQVCLRMNSLLGFRNANILKKIRRNGEN